jgi:hypothetical protein
MPATPAYTTIKYENRSDLKGGSATRIVTCAWADREAVRTAFVFEDDPDDVNLRGMSGVINPLNNDCATGTAVIEIVYAPVPFVNMRRTDAAFRFRIEASNESFLVNGAYQWPDGKPLANKVVLPMRHVARAKAVLYGSRSSFSLGDWTDYFDKVNSDVFLGAPVGTLLFKSVAASDRQDARTSALVYDVELHIHFRAEIWNKFWREETGKFEELTLIGGTDKMYAEIAFAGLLTAP